MMKRCEPRRWRSTEHGGDPVEAYLAQPMDGAADRGGGRDPPHARIRRGHQGDHPEICRPRLPGRVPEPVLPRGARRQPRRRRRYRPGPGGVPDARLVGDVAGAVAHLRSLPSSNGKVATIGYCSGGRQSFLAACSLELDAAVDCYGAFVIGSAARRIPAQGRAARPDRVKDLSCPLLGLFGAEDQYPAPEEVDELERAPHRGGQGVRVPSYEGAGHAFFATDRPSYRPEAAIEGWQRIWDFFSRHPEPGLRGDRPCAPIGRPHSP